jgi:hypothetical protein
LDSGAIAPRSLGELSGREFREFERIQRVRATIAWRRSIGICFKNITNNSRCDTAVTALGAIRFKFAPFAPKESWAGPARRTETGLPEILR